MPLIYDGRVPSQKTPRLKLPLKLAFQVLSVGVALAAGCGDGGGGNPDAQVDSRVSDAGSDRPDSEMFSGYCLEGPFPGIDGSLCPGMVHSPAECPPGCMYYG